MLRAPAIPRTVDHVGLAWPRSIRETLDVYAHVVDEFDIAGRVSVEDQII
jgi:hypothetical protein